MNVLIVGGGGTIGSATAAYLAWKEIVDTVYILDLNENMAESHAMDLAQSAFSCSHTQVKAGDWSKLADCQMMIVAAGLPASVATHDYSKDLASLMPLIQQIAQALRQYNPNAVVLSMTNPLDAFNYTLYQVSGLPARQFLALSQNDTLRFQWALAEHLGCRPEQVGCYVVGEHGPGKIPLFSTVTVDGQPKSFPPQEQQQIQAEMAAWWKKFLEVSGNRTAGWTSGAAAAQVVEAVAGLRKAPIACSVILEERQGYSMGWPVELDATGVRAALPPHLTDEETNQVSAAKAALKAAQEEIWKYLGLDKD